MSEPGHRRLAVLFFSDIAGYSRQMDADEAGTLARLEIHNAILDEEIARRGGRVIKTVGDAYMAEFPSAVEAVRAALDAQRAFARHNDEVAEGERIDIRIGVHAGDVVERKGDLFGETVNQAARLEARAPLGGLCVSAAVYDQVRKKIHATGEDLGEISLKGIESPVHVFVLRPASEQLALPKTSLPPPRLEAPPKPWATPPRIGALVAVGIGLIYLKTREPPPDRPEAAAAVTASVPAALGSAPPADASPRRGGTLRVASHVSRGTFDYFFNTPSLSSLALDLVTDTLFRRADDGRVIPGAVDHVRSLDAGRTVELHVRDGLRFHDHPCFPSGKGREASTKDLVFSLELAAEHGALPTPMLTDAADQARKSTTLRAASVHEGNVVRIALGQAVAEPDKMMLRIFLLPHELAGCDDARNMKRPVGTGPFRFAEDPRADLLHLVRSDQAWEREGSQSLPWVDALELRSLEDTVEAVRLITAGGLDLYEGGRAMKDPSIELDEDVPLLRSRLASPRVAVAANVNAGQTMILALLFLPRMREKDASLALRQAIAASLDPEALLGATGGVRPLGRFLEPRLRGYDPGLRGITKRIPEAEKLLAAAHHPRGKGLPELVVAAGLEDRAVADKIRDSLAEIGLKVRLVEAGGSSLPVADSQVQVDALLTNIVIGTFGDELAFHRLAGFFDRFGPPDPEMTKLLNDLQGASDRGERAALSQRLEERLLHVLPAIPIGTLSPTSAASFSLIGPRVRGFADAATARTIPVSGAPYARVHLVDPP